MIKNKKLKPSAQLRKILDQTNKKPQQMTSLELTGLDLAQFPQQFLKRFKEFSYLQSLSLLDCSIRILNKIPDFVGLRFLDLTNNFIKDEQIPILIKFKVLVSLNLSMNQIENISVYRHLSKLFYLEILDLFDNPITFEDTYRETAFEKINKLRSLDGQDADGHVVDDLSDYDEDNILSQKQSEDEAQEPAKIKRRRRTKKEINTYEGSDDQSPPPLYGRK